MTECRCENSTDGHGDASCPRPAVRPAPVQYLRGEMMCDPCIDAYVAAGYGLADRCACDRTCISCAERPPEYDVPTVGPLCGPCVGNGQGEPFTEQATDHDCRKETT